MADESNRFYQLKQALGKQKNIYKSRFEADKNPYGSFLDPEMTNLDVNFFNTNLDHKKVWQHDRSFYLPMDYNEKKHRCDKTMGKLLHMAEEEAKRAVPLTPNSTYGKRPAGIDFLTSARPHNKVAIIARQFFRNTGVQIPQGKPAENIEIAK